MDETVVAEFFTPAVNALGRVHYAAGRFLSLPMEGFRAFGCLRHLMGIGALREQIQQLFHLTDTVKMPVAGSTYSDAISSERRLEILQQPVKLLGKQAQALLPDRLADIPGLGDRTIYAVDGSYQEALRSSYYAIDPKYTQRYLTKFHYRFNRSFDILRSYSPAHLCLSPYSTNTGKIAETWFR